MNHSSRYGVAVPAAHEALRSVPLLAAAADDEIARLADSASTKRLARGQVLFTEGEATDHLHVVQSGRVKVLVSSPRGDELVLTVLGEGEVLGELSVVDQAPRSATVVALDDAVLWAVPAGAVRELLLTTPGLALAVAAQLAGRVRALTGVAADQVFLDLPRRLAKLLLSDEGRRTPTTTVPQGELAAQLGVARQSVNKALQRLQDRGWIEIGRSSVEVRDAEALARFAES